jgi:putative SOS response-associated peptidase YedK
MNVINDPLCQIVSETLGIKFKAESNSDLCPSQTVSTIIADNGHYQQLDTRWGIQPDWSKRLIINAQSETVAQKPTFKNVFESNRCLVPCSSWYEWRVENGNKIKYQFNFIDNQPMYMAGIWYQSDTPQLITLTTSPNEKCQQYHKRMPVIIMPENIDYWFNSTTEQLHPLMHAVSSDLIDVARVDLNEDFKLI